MSGELLLGEWFLVFSIAAVARLTVVLTMSAPGWSDTCVFSALLLCELQSSAF